MAEAILAELVHFGMSPPFVAYVQAAEGENVSQFYICRHLRPDRPQPSSDRVDYVSYKAPIGRLAAAVPGETAMIQVPELIGGQRTGGFWTTKYLVHEKDHFEAHQDDAIRNQAHFASGSLYVPSLRGFLKDLEAAVVSKALKPARRRVADKFELQDLAIVDQRQDDIFRVPISTFLLIDGAPGTGKTTTLIKRLAQKTNPEFLLENNEIRKGDVELLRTAFKGPTNWALFIPSELLRGYLKEALAQEHLAATEDNVLVWREYRVTFARDVLRILKTGSRPGFVLQEGLAKPVDSRRLASWTLDFARHYQEQSVAGFAQEVGKVQVEVKETTDIAHQEIRDADEKARILQQKLDELTSSEAIASSERDRTRLQQETATIERQIDAILNPVEEFRIVTDAMSRLAEEARAASSGATQYRAGDIARRVRDIFDEYTARMNNLLERRRAARIGEVREEMIDPRARPLKAALENVLRNHTLDSILQKLGSSYQEFRVHHLDAAIIHPESAASPIRSQKIDPIELDTVIFAGLLILREALAGTAMEQLPGGRSITRLLVNEMRMVVAVDEATDFSSTELACMRLLAHPRFNSLTLSGDLMQRMTGQGIRDWKEVEQFGSAPTRFGLKVAYRQSPRLLRIASALYRQSVGEAAPFESAYGESSDDPQALKFQGTVSTGVRWISDRAVEIYRFNRERLPTIAILVPSEDDVQAIHDQLKGYLGEESIESEACHDGRILGTKAKVRVFNVQYIKGLEFEAVFFVGLDRIASLFPELISRYVYVGLTRARNFLAVTYETSFPSELAMVESEFAASTWAGLKQEGEDYQSSACG